MSASKSSKAINSYENNEKQTNSPCVDPWVCQELPCKRRFFLCVPVDLKCKMGSHSQLCAYRAAHLGYQVYLPISISKLWSSYCLTVAQCEIWGGDVNCIQILLYQGIYMQSSHDLCTVGVGGNILM